MFVSVCSAAWTTCFYSSLMIRLGHKFVNLFLGVPTAGRPCNKGDSYERNGFPSESHALSLSYTTPR